MDKTYRTAAVIVPPDAVWAPIQRIRQQHDRHYSRWMPHITLLYPFPPREMWPRVSDALQRACQQIQPFEVELAGFQSFTHRSSCTLWLAPTPKSAWIDLQTTLWKAVPDCDDTRQHADGFTPHLSVGQVRKGDAAAELQAELQDAWTPVRFLAHEIHLIWREEPPDDIFRIGQTLPLGTPRAGPDIDRRTG